MPKKQGYNIKVLKGYQFNKVENVFDNYVYDLSLKKINLKVVNDKL
jgi:DNA polymerase type B, organellar and viral